MDNSSISRVISTESGLAASEKLGAAAYVECSALTQDGLKLAFDCAIQHALSKKERERSGDSSSSEKGCMGCSIM